MGSGMHGRGGLDKQVMPAEAAAAEAPWQQPPRLLEAPPTIRQVGFTVA